MKKSNTPLSSGRNPFVALCGYASQNQWCWKAVCTTCGHSDFRMAFSKLIRGLHPDEEIFWPNDKSSGSLYKEIKLYNDFSTYRATLNVQEKLAAIVANAKLSDIQKVAAFPDWLGYIGLVLHHCNDAEAAHMVSDALLPQFIEIVSKDSETTAYLQNKLAKHDLLSVDDLSIIESAMT